MTNAYTRFWALLCIALYVEDSGVCVFLPGLHLGNNVPGRVNLRSDVVTDVAGLRIEDTP